MPAAVPLIGAAFSVSAGLEIGGLLGGLMVAGGGLTAIGSLTGNKDLTMLGSVLGLAGGLGNLAGLGSTVAETTNAVGTAAADAGASTTVNAGGNVVQGVAAAPVTEAGGSAIDQAMSTSSQASQALNDTPAGPWGDPVNKSMADSMRGGFDRYSPYASPSSDTGINAGLISGESPSLSSLLTSDAGATSAMQGGFGDTPGSSLGNEGYSSYVSPSSYTGANASLDTARSSVGVSSPGDWLNRMKEFGVNTAEFMKKYPELTKLGGGVIGGAMDYLGKQSLAESNMQREMAYKDWLRQRYSDSVRNLRVPGLTPANGVISAARG